MTERDETPTKSVMWIDPTWINRQMENRKIKAPNCPSCFLPMSLYARSFKIRGNYECVNIHCTHTGQVNPETGESCAPTT